MSVGATRGEWAPGGFRREGDSWRVDAWEESEGEGANEPDYSRDMPLSLGWWAGSVFPIPPFSFDDSWRVDVWAARSGVDARDVS
jgi:hypothetical protein